MRTRRANSRQTTNPQPERGPKQKLPPHRRNPAEKYRVQAQSPSKPSFYEFFAGSGMVRAGLGKSWRCLFSNDMDPKKGQVYRFNWGSAELRTADVATLSPSDLPPGASLAWASFPCQDLSLAGDGAGLAGQRSSAFWPFWHLMLGLQKEGRAPGLIVLENVCGLLTSHHGQDFAAICGTLQQAGYKVGAIVVDAELFVPQSRPRLFILAVEAGIQLPPQLTAPTPVSPWHTRTLETAYQKLPHATKDAWLWWNLPAPPHRAQTFAGIIEPNPQSVSWFNDLETERLLAMMSPLNREKVTAAQQSSQQSGQQVVGCIYKRTRPDESGRKVQRAEVRFDDIAGCLRTPAGGSSRQVVLIVKGHSIRARLISSRETARLMGLPDTYVLPQNYNEAYHLTGDGVAVPVVRYLARHLFEPILAANQVRATVAA